MLYKSCRDLQQKSIVPTHLPYVVSLVRFYETDTAIYLQLQHAAGGRLWSYVGAYLNQCIDATANVYYNIEPHRPADDIASAKKDQVKVDRVDSDPNLSHFPADSITTSASAACDEFGDVDLKSKLSSDLDSVEESREAVDSKVSTASSPECSLQGFGELLQSANSEMKYFRIDSSDSSEHTSRQVSCSSAEDSFCRVHSTAILSGICRFCADAETPRPAACSDNGTNSPDETSIYDICGSKTGDKQMQEAGGSSTHFPGSSSAGEESMEDDKLRYSAVRPSSQERSFDSCSRLRRRNLSSAFGELDLAESTFASTSAPLRPLVHLPENCIRQWAAEMVVAISRLHSIGIICWQVDLSFLDCNFGAYITHAVAFVINRVKILVLVNVILPLLL